MREKNNQCENTYYSILPKARPLHHKSPIIINKIFEYTENDILNTVDKSQPNQYLSIFNRFNELNTYHRKDNSINKSQIHEIGESFELLFKNPVYKMHKYLNHVGNNQQFGSCSIHIEDTTKIKVTRQTDIISKNILQFQSAFESGNLAYASVDQKDQFNYYLFLHKDFNSRPGSSTQWFYFSVKNNNNLGRYTFNIVNYVKAKSAFELGMKPCVLSKKLRRYWMREGTNLKYRKNSIKRDQDKKFYTFSFSYQFIAKQDCVYFAYCYPYTYTRLMNFLNGVEQKHSQLVHRKTLSYSIGGNPIQMLTITNTKNNDNKKVILISARVHPGQTVSSFICEGIISFILGNSQYAKQLRNQFIIKIFPMLNPDGVINGNYRTSLSGSDLNRKWKNPDKNKFPQIYYVKKAIIQIQHQKCLYIDLHGHSKKKSSFMYGCQDILNPHLCKEFPYLMSKKGHEFHYFSCNFSTPKHRQGTSRIALWKQLDIKHSYTFEASFCGPIKKDTHFQIKDYIRMGYLLCQVIYLYFCPKNEDIKQIQDIISMMYKQKEILQVGGQDSNGSSSNHSIQQYQKQRIFKNDKNSIIKKISPNRQSIFKIGQYTNTQRIFGFQKYQHFKSKKPIQSPFKQRGGDNSYKIPVTKLQLTTSTNILPPSKSLSLRRQISQTFYENTYLKDKFMHSNLIFKGLTKPIQIQTNSPQLMIPLRLRNQYKKYQRYRRQQYELRVSQIYGQRNYYRSNDFISNKFTTNIKDNSMIDSIRKKQLKNVDKRNKNNLVKQGNHL